MVTCELIPSPGIALSVLPGPGRTRFPRCLEAAGENEMPRQVPFQREIEDLFSSDKSIVWKLLGGGFVGGALAAKMVWGKGNGPPMAADGPGGRFRRIHHRRHAGRALTHAPRRGRAPGRRRQAGQPNLESLLRPRQRLPDGVPLGLHDHRRDVHHHDGNDADVTTTGRFPAG